MKSLSAKRLGVSLLRLGVISLSIFVWALVLLLIVFDPSPLVLFGFLPASSLAMGLSIQYLW